MLKQHLRCRSFLRKKFKSIFKNLSKKITRPPLKKTLLITFQYNNKTLTT